MQHLLNLLNDAQYVEGQRVFPGSNVLRDIFWAHPVSIDLLKSLDISILLHNIILMIDIELTYIWVDTCTRELTFDYTFDNIILKPYS
ncbi:hypothetical protein Scep_026502 [Stephania cephalantha]|uniref:Uncharacterized protein n=1 Tax=Stephania cephalantha TaxID=152367 RepID=A0AAP0ESJ3_9MAGN